MSNYIEKAEALVLPVIPLRGTVCFPQVQLNIEIIRGISLKAFGAAAAAGESRVFLVAQKDAGIEKPEAKDLYRTGTIARIRQVVKNPEGNLSVIFEGLSRAVVETVYEGDGYLKASVISKSILTSSSPSEKAQALMHQILVTVDSLREINPGFSEDARRAAESIHNPSTFADFVASAFLMEYHNKQSILEALAPFTRLERLLVCLAEESEILTTEFHIHKKVRAKIDEHQKDYFLREQIKAIQQELGEDADEIEEYAERISSLKLPTQVEEKLMKELGRLSKTPFGASESTVLRNYLDTCLEIPWTKTSKEQLSVQDARRILDADHDGLDKVKERILEYIAVRQLTPEIKNQILCLVGPPGVGKTSVAASVARALHRKFVRVSLGGVRDEADIRGHRKTYVGAMPGRIIEALTSAGVKNPVIVLDEIDKLTRDAHGDPSSALLEVLDPEQNCRFRDHFVEMPIDLSDCLFIATANEYSGIAHPLLDRMEVIELSTYSEDEKLSIAKNHLIPKQLRRHGLTKRALRLSDETILEIIRKYTTEAGVRNLERTIASLCRKAARELAESDQKKSVTISPKNLRTYLGKIKHRDELPEESDPIGIVNGLAYTQSGGDLLKVEALVLAGTGKLSLSGSLGDVMKESGSLAVSYVRSVADRYGIPALFYKENDLHVHFPEGAVPKDGPSAGVAMTVALISALSGRAVCRDVAMTGEITLHGKILSIGGLREKTLAAARSGIRRVIIPYGNLDDLDEVDPKVKESLEFIPCKTVEEALSIALVRCGDENALPICDATGKRFFKGADSIVGISQKATPCEELPL